MKKVIIIERIFSFYRKPVFDRISKRANLKLLSGKNNSGIKTLQTTYSESIPSFQYGKKDTSIFLFPLYKIFWYRPRVVISDFAMGMLNLPIIIFICKLFGVKFAFWSHGYNRTTGFHPEESWSDKYRLFLLKMVDANIVYSQSDRNLLRQFLKKDNIFVAQNTLDTVALGKIRADLEIEGSRAVKDRLAIKHSFNLVFIGRLLSSKSPDLLVDIYTLLKTKYDITVGIHFVGDGEMGPLIRKRVEDIGATEDFYFHGAIHDPRDNGAILFACDLMVLPGALGLSVNHAFCFDCPVVSFKRKNGYPAHGPEVEYLVDYQTGFLVSDHTPEAMAASVYEYFNDPALQDKMQKNVRHAVDQVFPLEKMVGGAMECIEYLTARRGKS